MTSLPVYHSQKGLPGAMGGVSALDARFDQGNKAGHATLTALLARPRFTCPPSTRYDEGRRLFAAAVLRDS
jgi:hypothetical protein